MTVKHLDELYGGLAWGGRTFFGTVWGEGRGFVLWDRYLLERGMNFWDFYRTLNWDEQQQLVDWLNQRVQQQQEASNE